MSSVSGPSRRSFLCGLALFSSLVLGGCASTTTTATPSGLTRAVAAARVEREAPPPSHAAAARHGAHAVLSTGKRTFVLTGELSGPGAQGERQILAGGFALETDTRSAAASRRFTLVGPEGRCSARATHSARVSVDYGGYAAASLPGPKHAAFEIEGCDSLTHEHAFLIALDGDDPGAEWIHPAHVGEVQVPADRRLGESEVWLHRWALPKADLEIVERNVLMFVTPSCSEERRDVLVVDELDHPVARHEGFYLRGAIQTASGPLLVLMGHDEPEALRIVELGVADTRITLDTRLELFQDVERAEC